MTGDLRTCELCGRELTAGFHGTVCAVCRQEYQELKDKQEQRKAAQLASEQAAQSVKASSGLPVREVSPVSPDPTPTPVPGAVAAQPVLPPLTPEQQTQLRHLADIALGGAVAWLAVGCIQLLLALMFHWAFAIAGVWNIIISISRFNRAQQIRNRNGAIPGQVEKELAWYVVFIIINLVLGAVIGIAGAVVDIILRERILGLPGLFSAEVERLAGLSSDKAIETPKPKPRGLAIVLLCAFGLFFAFVIYTCVLDAQTSNISSQQYTSYYEKYQDGGSFIAWRDSSFSMVDRDGHTSGRSGISNFEMARTAKSRGSHTYSYRFQVDAEKDVREVEYTIDFYDKGNRFIGSSKGECTVFSGNADASGTVTLADVPARYEFADFRTRGGL